MRHLMKRVAGSLAALALVAFSGAAWAETKAGTVIEARVILAYKVNDAAAAAFLPDDWTLLTLPNGPLAGTNLLVSFIDRYLALDADGAALTPHDGRAVAIVGYGVKPGFKGAKTFVTRVYETGPVTDVYGNSVAARIGREMTLSGPADGPRTQQEAWTVAADGGGTLDMRLSYTVGRSGWSAYEITPYSSVKPDFHRIYRYEGLTDLAMSTALDKALEGDVTLTTDIADLAGMFDGRETLTGVMVVPVRVRDIFLP